MPIVRSLRMELKFHCQSLILYYSPHPLRYIVENHWQIGLGELLSRCELFWCSLCSPPPVLSPPHVPCELHVIQMLMMGPFYIMTSSTAPFQRERSSVGGIPAGMPCSHSSQMPRPPRFYWGIFIPILRSNKNPCGDSIVILYRSWSTVTMACCYLYIKKEEPDVSGTSNKPIVIIHICASKSSIRMKRLRFVSQTRSLRCRQRFTGNAHYFHGLGSSREHIKQIY